MKRTKTSAKKNTQEEGSSQREKQRPKKWDKSDTTHYSNMKKVTVPATQLACPETMTILGIKSDIGGLFQNMGLGQLCNLNEPTYPELVRQFIASAYVSHPDDSHQESFLAFVVKKVYFEVSFTDLFGLFGLSAGERTSGLYWTSELLNFWETIGTGVYRSSQAKESHIRNPVLRYATRLIGSLLYGTTTAASVTQWELYLMYQGVRHLLPAFGNSTFPPATAFNMGAVLAANLAGYKGKVTKSKSSACGFGAVITRILTHVGVDCENHQVALDRSNNIAWNYLDVISLVSKEFIAGPYSRIDRDDPYVYVFQDRAKKTLYCHLPQIGLTALLSEAANVAVPPTQLACPQTMMKLAIKADIEGLFQNMGLGQLCNLNEPTYPELVRQFIASTYVNRPNDSHQEGFLAFVVQKVYFELSFTDLCGLFGLRITYPESGTEICHTPHWLIVIRDNYNRICHAMGVVPLLPRCEAFATGIWKLFIPTCYCLQHGSGAGPNLAGYKGRVTKSKNSACGFGVVITRILRHVGVDFENHQVALDRSHNIAWNYLDIISLVSKEFIAGPHSKNTPGGPYVYVFQDRAKKTLYCHLPQIGLTVILSEAAVEFLPPANALIDKPSFFTPKYQCKGKAVDDEEGEDEAAQAVPNDDSQPHQLLPSDSSQYKLQELPPNATARQQQHWRDQSIKTNNDMLHKI
ncbi:hypothetical protein DY000_02009626 [Brassica cretica]|uniref:Arabidopsis retrotransposon Orf1 C-terminal domain-containing protein n=1 Tax=Brassica cretica TaxID=69181 RepID=A0ABQ7CBA3_BRACR|nr:hypothetical protein DY000_02009626 [Brassica cretica]